MYWILFIGIMVISLIVQTRFKNKFKKYSEIPLTSGLTGAEIAQKMLYDNGIYDVKVVSIPDRLGDHYNPADKTVNLSPEVYSGRSIAAAAVSAHECGHAVQHATAYKWLGFRSAMVPMVSFASKLTSWVLMLGVILMAFSQNYIVLAIGVAALAITTIFSFVTLPVEFDASIARKPG
ncbi:membrane protein [Sphingobacterium sp. IITKGP-BTPF85]|nr:membrane protein [Sphingobacterium sp. IITKGP-BTPF85]